MMDLAMHDLQFQAMAAEATELLKWVVYTAFDDSPRYGGSYLRYETSRMMWNKGKEESPAVGNPSWVQETTPLPISP